MMHIDEIKTVAVLGLGTMGHSIAQTFAVAGYNVRTYDRDDQVQRTAVERMRANMESMAAAGLIDEAAIPVAFDRLTLCETEEAAVREADFVTEAIWEDLSLKQALFERIEAVVAGETILVSNTSSYPMTNVAASLRRPERTVNTHWFNPPHIIPVVEVVPGEHTSPETANTAYELLKRIGKLPVHIKKEIPGFIVNRVQAALHREVLDLLEREIASAEDIDLAIRASMGLRLAAAGPLAICDFAGLDIVGKVYETLAPDLRSDSQLPDPLRIRIDQGRLGPKTGSGIYDYPAGSVSRRIADRDRRYLALLRALDEKTHD
jgi:3-hydroxyacyl-CoA dehydrogenase